MCSAEELGAPVALELMTTSGCHLCDRAVEVIVKVLDNQRFSVDLVDIAFNEELFERYSVNIPVLLCVETGKELAWPFDQDQLSTFAQDLLTNRHMPGKL